MAKPAARLTDPMCCPNSGDSETRIETGSPDVFIEGLPAAREGDITACGSVLVSGLSSTVFINGRPAAMVGSMGDHGDIVITGASSVIIGNTYHPDPFTPSTNVNIVYSRSFLVLDSETRAPLPLREYIATVGSEAIQGKTDAQGLAKIRTQSPGELIQYM